MRLTLKAHNPLHLLISCLIYISSTAEGGRESRTSQVYSRGERDMLIRCYSNRSWQTCISLALTHTSALTDVDLTWLVRLSAVCTSLAVVIGCASSGQQLGLQAFDLSVFGSQELLQIWDFSLRTKTWCTSMNSVSLPGHLILTTRIFLSGLLTAGTSEFKFCVWFTS